MSDSNTPHHKSDDELLAEAIPIDTSEEEDELEELEPVDEAAKTRHKAEIDLIDETQRPQSQRKIEKSERQSIESPWKRTPIVTGQGAAHMKTFVCKLRPDAIELLDSQVNQWLDDHPEYEVKFANTTVGEMQGKSREPTLFLTVWV